MARSRDPLAAWSLRFFLAGLMTMPALSIRLPLGLALSDLFFVLSAGALALSQARSPLPMNRSWMLAAWLVAVGGVLASFRADSLLGNLAVVARMLFILVVWQWNARRVLTTTELVRKATWAFAAGCSLSALTAVAQVSGYLPLPETLYGRALGLTAHPNDAGGTLGVGFILAVGLMLGAGRGRGRWSPAAMATLIALGLLLSGSVTGVATALIGLLAFVVRRDVAPRVVMAAVVGLLVAYVGATSFQAGLEDEGSGFSTDIFARLDQTTGGAGEEQNTLLSRLRSDEAALQGIEANPIVGRGLDLTSGLVHEGKSTHNFVLLTWYQGGILVLVGLTLAILSAIRLKGRAGDRRYGSVRESLLSASVGALAFSMTAPVLFDRYFWLPFVLLVALKSADTISGRRERRTRPGVLVKLDV